MAIEEITAFLEPPESPTEVRTSDWSAVEAKYDVHVPSDFKEFVGLYGTGCIGDFLWVLNPFSENKFLNFESSEAFHDRYAELKSEFPDLLGYPEPPADGCLFPFATTDNGDTFCWVVDKESNRYTCTIIGADPTEEAPTELGFKGFMVGVLQGELGGSILPEDFLIAQKRFVPQIPSSS